MAKSQWLNDESQLQEVVYGELDARLSDLVAQIRSVDGGFALLRFLQSNPNTLRTVDDIAYYLHQSPHSVERSVRALMKLNLVRRVEAGGVIWFGMTGDPDHRRLVFDLCAWQDRWHTRLAQIDQVVNGRPGLSPEMVPFNSEFKQVVQ